MRQGASVVVLTSVLCGVDPAGAADPVRAMSLNMAVGGEAMNQPLERTAVAVRTAGTDVATVEFK